MRGTQWRDSLLRSVEVGRKYKDTEDLLMQLKGDRELALAKQLFDSYPHFVESHPLTTQVFLEVYDNWVFRSHISIGTPEEIAATMEEHNIQL
jgi:hypothetical protein